MSNEIIKNNANNILKNQDKYYFVGTFGKKGGLLSSSRSKTEAKNEAIDKLENKKNILEQLDHLRVFLLTIKKVTKEEKIEHKEATISLVGGPLVITIEEYQVNNKDSKLSFKNLEESLNNRNKVFVDKKYLKKYNSVDPKLIAKLGFKYSFNTIEGAFFINTLTKYNK